jgi:hypothetical protein
MLPHSRTGTVGSSLELCSLDFRSLDDSRQFTSSSTNFTTDGQSASLSWNQTTICDSDQFFFLSTEIIFRYLRLPLVWGALSDEKTGL